MNDNEDEDEMKCKTEKGSSSPFMDKHMKSSNSAHKIISDPNRRKKGNGLVDNSFGANDSEEGAITNAYFSPTRRFTNDDKVA
jgi:hypothetical protein